MENHKSLAHSLTLYSATPLNNALDMQPSDIGDFFEGKPFGDWRKNKESEGKVQAAIGSRLNGVIRACGVIAKAIGQLSKVLGGRQI